MQETHRRINAIMAAGVFLAALLSFLLTAAPTVAFWDCGEYVAAAYSLGVPHPPGNPLFVMLGRVFCILLGFLHDPGFRVNLISVYASAFTAMFIYLIISRVMVSWLGAPDAAWKRLVVYISGAVGALYAVWGYTFWFSAVESEVNATAMLIIAVCIWLSLVWAHSTDPGRDRYLVLFVYLAYLGIGVHMFTMLALIPVFPFVALKDPAKAKDWRLWICALLMGTVIYEISSFFWIGPFLAIVTGAMTFLSAKAKTQWRFCFYVVLFALLGYSVHLFIPIRSALNPIIDENHPVVEFTAAGVKWDAFKGYLERKQYGSESMIARMFWRRGSWAKQFGIDGHMGYGGFHLTQFFHFGKSVATDREKTVFENWGAGRGTFYLILYLTPTFLMIFGWYYLYKRNPSEAMLLIFFILLTTVLLVIYHNFADGQHAEKRDYMMWVRSGRQGPMPTVHREVRVRDYFYTPGFMAFGMWIGIAAGCLLHLLYTSKNTLLRTNAAPIASVLCALSPLLPLVQNFKENNRLNDWTPFDYAYNLLMSCKKDGVLITNGDNDTFPLWALQEAYNIRRDVRIVNLSLLNTTWYIKQLKNLEPKVPITFSELKIEALNHEVNPLAESIPYTLPNAGITVQLPGRRERNALRVQDKMVLHMVDANKWRKPIYFAVTVSNDNMMGLQPYLQMQGLAYEILPQKPESDARMDIERTEFLLDKIYRFNGLGISREPMNETTEKLLSNYAACYIQIALMLRNPLLAMKDEVEKLETSVMSAPADTTGRLALAEKRAHYEHTLNRALTKLDQCVSLMPWDWRPRALRQEFLMTHGRFDEALDKIRQARRIDPKNVEYMKIEAQILDKLGRRAEANTVLKELAQYESDSWNAYAYMCTTYEELGMWDSAIAVIEDYQRMHPGDRRAAATLARLYNLKKTAKETPAESTAETAPAAAIPGPG